MFRFLLETKQSIIMCCIVVLLCRCNNVWPDIIPTLAYCLITRLCRCGVSGITMSTQNRVEQNRTAENRAEQPANRHLTTPTVVCTAVSTERLESGEQRDSDYQTIRAHCQSNQSAIVDRLTLLRISRSALTQKLTEQSQQCKQCQQCCRPNQKPKLH